MKAEYTAKLEELEARLVDSGSKRISLEPLLKKGLQSLFNLNSVYHTSSLEKKRELIDSLFPGKITFDGTNILIGRINEAAKFIYSINSNLEMKKVRNKGQVNLAALEAFPNSFSHHFLEDLRNWQHSPIKLKAFVIIMHKLPIINIHSCFGSFKLCGSMSIGVNYKNCESNQISHVKKLSIEPFLPSNQINVLD